MNTSYSKCHCKDINMFNQIIYLIYVKCNFFIHAGDSLVTFLPSPKLRKVGELLHVLNKSLLNNFSESSKIAIGLLLDLPASRYLCFASGYHAAFISRAEELAGSCQGEGCNSYGGAGVAGVVVEDLSGCPGLVAPWLHTKLVACPHHHRGWGLLTISLYPLGWSSHGEPKSPWWSYWTKTVKPLLGEKKSCWIWCSGLQFSWHMYASRADIWNGPAGLQKIRSFSSWQGCWPFCAAVHELAGAATCSSLPLSAKPHGLEPQAAKPAVQHQLPSRMGYFSRKKIEQ